MKFLKFLFSGLLTYGINIGLTYIFVEYMFLGKPLSYALSISIVTIVNLIISLKVTFKKKYSHKLFVKYLTALLSFSTANYLIVYALKIFFIGNWYYFLIFLVTTILFFLKYEIYDRYVFK